MNRIARKLIKQIPKDVSNLILEVNSVPGLLDDAKIYETWAHAGIFFEGKTHKNGKFSDHFRGGLIRTYPHYLKMAVNVCAYFSATGVNVKLIDSKRDGTYVSVFNRH